MTTTAIERRIRALESRQRDDGSRLSLIEQQAAFARLLEQEELTENQAVARFGSMPAFLHHLMTRPNPDCTPLEGDVLEQYRLMCR